MNNTVDDKKDKLTVVREQQVESLYNLIVNTNHEWTKKWGSAGYRQQNGTSKEYSGRNQLRLFEEAITKGHTDPRWFTFNQIKKNNLKLEKGAKGALIDFYTSSKMVLKVDENNKPLLDSDGKKQYKVEQLTRPVHQSYYIFNASNIEGLEKFSIKEVTPEIQAEKYKQLDLMIDKYCKENKIEILEMASSKAFFRTETDVINKTENYKVVMPLKEQFKDQENYYSVIFHELAHSTSNLLERSNREGENYSFGSKNYAKEELTAELSALLMCQKYGIINNGEDKENNLREQSLAYLKNWLKSGVLEKEDLSHSLNDALKAVNLITGYDLNHEKEMKKTVVLEIEDKGSKIKYSLKDNNDQILFSEIGKNLQVKKVEIVGNLNKFLDDNNLKLSDNNQKTLDSTLKPKTKTKQKDEGLSL